ncbi:MAG TPA: hypothetical protein VF476_10825 [Chitinophagaceae bacterium]
MKKNISWGIYFLICAAVITTAIIAGTKHFHCHECGIAFGDSAKSNRLADYWLYKN